MPAPDPASVDRALAAWAHLGHLSWEPLEGGLINASYAVSTDSDAAGYVTGQLFPVDGGWLAG